MFYSRLTPVFAVLNVNLACSFSGGTSVLWWLYIDYRMTMNETMSKDLRETEEPNGGMKTPKDHAQGLLIYAVSATVFTVSSQRNEI